MAGNLKDLDFVGIEIPLRFKVGSLLNIALEIVDASGDPVNVTGRTYTFRISTNPIVAFVQVNTDALNGLINMTLDTDSLAPGPYRWEGWEDNNRFLGHGPVEIIAQDIT